MKKSLLVFYFLIFLFQQSHSQSKVYEGVLKDINSKEALAYVNIGVLNKNSGTVSDVNGQFQLVLDEKYDNEILKISIIGYKSIIYNVADFKKAITENKDFFLEKEVAELKEIIISNKKMQTRNFGNVLEKKTVSAGFVNNVLGNEIGMIIKIKKKPTFIKAFHAIVDYNHYKEFKFRLNFYDLKDGLPNNSILQESIIVTSTIKKGKLSVDLDEYDIVVQDDFFVAIELIEGLGEGGLHFLADYSGNQIISRAASQGKWKKQEDVSFGFSVTAKY